MFFLEMACCGPLLELVFILLNKFVLMTSIFFGGLAFYRIFGFLSIFVISSDKVLYFIYFYPCTHYLPFRVRVSLPTAGF